MAEATTKELQRRQAGGPAGVERMRERKVFTPRADVYETEDKIVLLVDMPGVDQKNVEITLEKNVLTLTGTVDDGTVEGHSLTYAEYQHGDYQRSFLISAEVDRERIQATLKNGVLQVTLPKAESAKARKIPVAASDGKEG